MSKITNDGLTRSGKGCFIPVPYGNSGRQRVNRMMSTYNVLSRFSLANVPGRISLIRLNRRSLQN